MANWKKVIVSGSNAELSSLTVSNNQFISPTQSGTRLTGSFTGSFIGDGANLTGVTATAVFPVTQTSPILSTTKLFSNDGANTFVYVGQVTGSTYAGISGDITIGTGGVSAIGSSKVTSGMIVDGTITGTDIASATVANANLVNSTITIGSTSTALGASNTTIAGLVSVSSTGFTGSLFGNASTATALQTARTINGTSFDGSADITVTANAGTLIGATLASNVLASSLTSVGTLAGLTATGTTALTTLTVSGDATVTGNLSVAGTASFTNVDNLNIRDKFILINSGSSALADSGWVTQYNVAGSGSAFYLEAGAAGAAGAYGRFAVAYDVVGTSTSLTPDEFVVTARVSASADVPTNPTWGGSSNGSGNMFVNSNTGDIYIYS